MSDRWLAILCDFPEEGWPSMDLAASMLYQQLATRHTDRFTSERVCPPFCHRLMRLPGLGSRRLAFNADRLLNRLWDYPRFLKRHVNRFDLFHVADHSYAQLVHVVPPPRTGVYCHDLDAFRCLIEPRRDPRPRWFRALARHVLRGLQKAAVVFHSTCAVRREIEHYGLVDPARLVHAPYGYAEEFTCEQAAAGPAAPLLLHVGSCIPRKRIDVLLNVLAALRQPYPNVRLIKVGGPWSAAQIDQIERLGLANAVTQLVGLTRVELAGLYRQAALVLMPSEAEGFGLPVLEALACGAVVVASDIPALREVGGDAVVYCPVGDVAQWADTVIHLLDHPSAAPSREARLARAARFSWEAHARTILDAYLRLL